jgi:hypothetical protein
MDEQHSSPCDLANLYISSINDFVGEMIMSQYMLGLFVWPRLHSLRYGSTVFTMEIHRIGYTRNNTQLKNKISNPNNFLCSFRSNNILSFRRWIWYSILFRTFLAHRPSIEAEHKTWLRFIIIRVCLEASIGATQGALIHLQTQGTFP